MSRPSLLHARLYAILDLGYVAEENVEAMAQHLAAARVDVVQLRAKQLAPDAFLALARKIAPIFRAANIPFLLNDHPELVHAAGADGAHVGQDDLPVAEARRLAGPDAIIGKSTHSLAQAVVGLQEADYIGFGPLFSTPTKPEYAALGLAELGQVEALATMPVFGIGGIKLHNLPAVLHAGARRIVIVSELLQAANVGEYVRQVRAHWAEE